MYVSSHHHIAFSPLHEVQQQPIPSWLHVPHLIRRSVALTELAEAKLGVEASTFLGRKCDLCRPEDCDLDREPEAACTEATGI